MYQRFRHLIVSRVLLIRGIQFIHFYQPSIEDIFRHLSDAQFRVLGRSYNGLLEDRVIINLTKYSKVPILVEFTNTPKVISACKREDVHRPKMAKA